MRQWGETTSTKGGKRKGYLSPAAIILKKEREFGGSANNMSQPAIYYRLSRRQSIKDYTIPISHLIMRASMRTDTRPPAQRTANHAHCRPFSVSPFITRFSPEDVIAVAGIS